MFFTGAFRTILSVLQRNCLLPATPEEGRLMGNRSGSSVLAGAGDEKFVFAKRFDLRLANGDDGEGVAHGVEDLQFVAWFLAGAAFVVFHDGCDNAMTKALLRDILGERDAGEERIIHDPLGRCGLAAADAEYFVFLKRLERRFGNTSDRDGGAERVENLDGVSILAARHRVVVDDLNDIACAEIILRNIAGQNGISVELESHQRVLSGTNALQHAKLNHIRPKIAR